MTESQSNVPVDLEIFSVKLFLSLLFSKPESFQSLCAYIICILPCQTNPAELALTQQAAQTEFLYRHFLL